MMFYVQLGSVMEDFNDQTALHLLARALFGDFGIDDIMNNSSGYLNAVLFLVYLVAVFILLSMFLAILGEAQAAVRGDQDAEEEAGTPPPTASSVYSRARSSGPRTCDGQGAQAAAPRAGGQGGGGEERAVGDKDDKERAVNELKRELSSSLISIRTEVGTAQRVTALAGTDAEQRRAGGGAGR